MTICNVAIGSDRVWIVQDSGRFAVDPPHAQAVSVCKVSPLPQARMIAAGGGAAAVLSEWRKLLMAGFAGETLTDVAQHAPGLLRGLWRDQDMQTLVIVAALASTGRAGGLLLRSSRGFVAERLPPGALVLMPGTADVIAPVEPREPPPAIDAPTPADDAAEPDAEPEPESVDWTWLRRRLIAGTRQQIEQRRASFAAPFTSALLHPDGIDLREFRP
jgi:hypothetical protein